MTNSTPKLIQKKVERQCSPATGTKYRQYNSQRSSAIKTSTPFGNNNTGRNNNSRSPPNRQNCSPPYLSKSTRNSPLRQDSNSSGSPRGSPTGSFYAGPKFSEPPSPASLPKPPTHWTGRLIITSCQQSDVNLDFANHLKMILNVQA